MSAVLERSLHRNLDTARIVETTRVAKCATAFKRIDIVTRLAVKHVEQVCSDFKILTIQNFEILRVAKIELEVALRPV